MERIYFSSVAFLGVAYLILASASAGQSQAAAQGSPAQESCPGELMDVQMTGEREQRPVPEAVINGAPWGGTYWPAGARSYWHCHAGGQLLVIWEGEGFVQRRGERVRKLAVGESDLAPPWEEHWHGAGTETGVLFVGAVLEPGGTYWMEEVDAADVLGNDIGINSRDEFLRTGTRDKN
jgi:hypothetical protein